MNAARRWYIYLVCAISLQGLAWAVIVLLQNLLAGEGGGVTAIAFQIAAIMITVPLFLVHWLWAQRLAEREINEREASLRGIYHYAMMASFLGPVIVNGYDLISYILRVATGSSETDFLYGYQRSTVEEIIHNLIAISICTLLWFYQKRVVAEDVKASPEGDSFATIRRLYMFVFSAWGIIMTTSGIIYIFRWILFQFGRGGLGSLGMSTLMDDLALLIVGMPLWLTFWREAQRLFNDSSTTERDSALRKFYLYTTVFVAALTAVTNATGILAGLFRRILGLFTDSGDIRNPLSVIVAMGMLWGYHALVLREDATSSAESVRQGGVRRLYAYLIAGVGLAAFLVGLSGDLSVLIRSFSQNFGTTQKEQLAWFTAALIAGLPVWLIPWRQVQSEAVELTADGLEARRSVVRKIYLYFYLFLATMTVLSSAIYVLYRLLSLVLGERGGGNLVSGIAQAVAYSLVGIGVWLYHGLALRGDGTATRRELALRLKDIRVAILDSGTAGFGQALLDRLKLEELDLNFDLIALPAPDDESATLTIAKLGEAGLIVGPWSMAVEGGGVQPAITRAVVNSKARKLMIPARVVGWDLAGVDAWNADGLMQQTVRALKQWAGGEEIKAVRPMGIGGIIFTVIGVMILLALLIIPLVEFFLYGF